jgi:hypothetical protein
MTINLFFWAIELKHRDSDPKLRDDWCKVYLLHTCICLIIMKLQYGVFQQDFQFQNISSCSQLRVKSCQVYLQLYNLPHDTVQRKINVKLRNTSHADEWPLSHSKLTAKFIFFMQKFNCNYWHWSLLLALSWGILSSCR